MWISKFASERDAIPTSIECVWSDLVDAFKESQRSECTISSCLRAKCLDKRRGGAWSPAKYPSGSLRSNANVEAVSALVLDLDHLTDTELDATMIALKPYQRIVHASHSDHPGDRCVRVVLALSEPVSGRDWPGFWTAAIDSLNVPVDRVTGDASRLYFLPTRPSDVGYLFESRGGLVLDVPAILALKPSGLPAAATKEVATQYGASSPGLLERARQRLQEHGPAIEGQGGNAHARAAWGILTHDYALQEGEARELAIEWNTTCHPPWDLDDLFAGPMRSHQSWTSRRGAARDSFEANAPLHAALIGRHAKRGRLPEILITTDQKGVTDQAEGALAALGEVYVRGRTLVHVVRDRSAPGWLERPDGAPVIEPLPTSACENYSAPLHDGRN